MERTLVRAVLAMESQELERITEQKQMLTRYSEGMGQLEPTLHNVRALGLESAMPYLLPMWNKCL